MRTHLAKIAICPLELVIGTMSSRPLHPAFKAPLSALLNDRMHLFRPLNPRFIFPLSQFPLSAVCPSLLLPRCSVDLLIGACAWTREPGPCSEKCFAPSPMLGETPTLGGVVVWHRPFHLEMRLLPPFPSLGRRFPHLAAGTKPLLTSGIKVIVA